MLGAIIGDIVGSTRERENGKSEDFEMVPKGSRFTGHAVMTLAVAEWLMADPDHRADTLVRHMQELGARHWAAGYGAECCWWLVTEHPKPYGRLGNESAIRVSPVGLYAHSLEEALELARLTASVTHHHPEAIQGAQAVAACVYMQHSGRYGKDEMRRYVEETFGYPLDRKLEDIREDYRMDKTCRGSIPVAIMAFLQRDTAEAALRLAISMGGDSVAIGSMTAAMALAGEPHVDRLGRLPSYVADRCRRLLTPDLLDISDRFEAWIGRPLE